MAPPSNDPFDQLPDSLLLCILNKLQDIKALGRCSAVSKRFNLLVVHVEYVVVKVDCVISTEDGDFTAASMKGKGLFAHLLKLFVGGLVRPLHALQQLLSSKKSMLPEVLHHSPAEVLKNFVGVRHVRIELPSGELRVNDGTILKWRAEFGNTLESCVILAAASLLDPDGKLEVSVKDAATRSSAGGENPMESFFTNGGLKLRMVWTISSLIAASARHFLLQEIIRDHPALESLTLTDADGQGTLYMSRQQLLNFRDNPVVTSASSNRTQVPAVNLKLWYASSLLLPNGATMDGATLIAIKPSDSMVEKDIEKMVLNAFEEPFNDAAESLVRRRTYYLEMNAF